MIFTLTGFMGCGKSTIGKTLATRCGFCFADTDTLVCNNTGKNIPELFSLYGESGFRKLEYECLSGIIREYKDRNVIVSLGGGTVTYPPNEELVRIHTYGIYLCCPIDELVSNLNQDGVSQRPMFDGYDDIRSRVIELMDAREEIYRRCTKVSVHPYSLTSDYLLSCLDIDNA